MSPKNSGGSTKFPGGHKVIHRTAQTAFVRVVTPRIFSRTLPLDFFSVVLSVQILSHACKIANWYASCQLGFLTLLCSI